MSGQSLGAEVDVSVVNGAAHADGGVAHGTLLVAFVDACAVVGGFNVVDRIADATANTPGASR